MDLIQKRKGSDWGMKLFELFGSIFIRNKDANKTIDDTTNKAKNMADTLGKSLQKTGDKITKAGKKVAPLSLACGAFLTGAVKGASDFQDGMNKMSTLFDTSKTSVKGLSSEFLNLSNKTGISATELAEAGYQALSAGQSVDKVGKFVETAGNLAKAGFTSTTTAVDVLTTAMNAYGKNAGSADDIANKLVRTQNLGKTTVDELASSMGKIIPTASSMGVNIDNLTSGYVSLTKQGISTAESTTYMNSMLNELGDSSTNLGKIIKEKTGMSFQDCMKSGMSLGDVLKVTKDYADENGIAYNELWGNAEAGKAGLAILNGGVDEFNNTVGIMSSKTNDVGQALQKLESPSTKAKKAINEARNSGIEFGTSILISLTPAINAVTSGIERLTSWFNGLSNGTKTTIAVILALIAGLSPVLIVLGKVISSVGTIITLIPKISAGISLVMNGVKALWAILSANPIGLVIIAIMALVAGFTYLWNHCEGFRKFWIGLWNTAKSTISSAGNFIKGVIDRIKGFFNFKISWPHIPLPHFNIQPSGWNVGDLLKGKIPSLGIKWYAKAMNNPMILDAPTIFGTSNGQMLGAGEAGAEVVSGRDTLMRMISDASNNGSDDIVNALNRILALLSDEHRIHDIIVKALTDGSFSIVLDNREVGRIVRKYA